MIEDYFDYPLFYDFDISQKIYSVVSTIDLDKNDVLVNRMINCNDDIIKKMKLAEELKQVIKFESKDKSIILVDITGYSKGDDNYQAALLTLFHRFIKYSIKLSQIFSVCKIIEGFVPTGDGCYIIVNDKINDRFLRFAASLISGFVPYQKRLLQEHNRISDNLVTLRISAVFGKCSPFFDLTEKVNYFGTGMNEAARVMDYGRKEMEKLFPNISTENTIFVDQSLFSQIKDLEKSYSFSDKKPETLDLGDVEDKHGNKRHVYALVNIPTHIAFQLFSSEEMFRFNNTEDK